MDVQDKRRHLDKVIDTNNLTDQEVIFIYQTDKKQRSLSIENQLQKALKQGNEKHYKLRRRVH